ncbi:MAG TPA: helix-hairpin-helix domain-containing protein [Prolixibacteraceae bacterium]|nr:helix-hairpin-helix domain-containing protein [Prolixibacteraceae bacterium]
MNFKQIVQDYFTFSRNERKGITILLVIFFLLVVANKVIFYFETPAKVDADLLNAEFNLKVSPVNLPKTGSLFMFNPNTIDRGALDSLSLPEGIKNNIIKFREKGGSYNSAKDFKKMYGVTDSIYRLVEPFLVLETKTVKPLSNKKPVELFAFDPNTAGDTVFFRLGLTERQVQTIRNYQQKGGMFKKSSDLFRLYGIPDSQKLALAEYVVIKEKPGSKIETNETERVLIEINGTDSIELKSLPGIGNKLSKRIVKYRDMLGGFYSLEQLKEVYGLREETIRQIEGLVKIDPEKIHKIDLNFADWNELAAHPYIRNSLAQQIIKFRTRYGSISDPSVLKDSMILNKDEYERLKPYF